MIILPLREFWNLAPVLSHSRRRGPTTCHAWLRIDRRLYTRFLIADQRSDNAAAIPRA